MNLVDTALLWQLLPSALGSTLYMVGMATFFAILFGLPIGVILTVTSKGHLCENRWVYKLLEGCVNVGRSFPFAILMVVLIPFTKWLVGTSLGTTAAIVPLSVAAAPFFARLVETSLQEVDHHLIEATTLMGSNLWQMVTKVLLPEALPSLISGLTLTVINLIGYSAMAGMVGGGGLGYVAIQYGYHRFNTPVMVATVLLLILCVQVIQIIGNRIVKRCLIKRGK